MSVSNKKAAANARAILAQLTTNGKVDRKRFIAEMQSRSMEHFGIPLTGAQVDLLHQIAVAYQSEQPS